MNKKWFSGILIAIFIISVLLTGCGTDSEMTASDAPQSVSLVRRATKNFSSVSLNTESIYESLYNASYTYGNVSVISVEGMPRVICNYDLQKPDKNIADSKRKQIATDNVAVMIQEISQSVAVTPEADTLASIGLSADVLHSTPAESVKTMYIADSGVGTTGLFDLTKQNIIDMPVSDIVQQLEEIHAIPDLTDIHVVWIGFGQVCGEQKTLTSSYEYKLKERWTAILEAGGAASITFDTSPLAGIECAGDLPECSTVIMVEDMLKPDFEMSEVMKWDGESSVTFVSNKASFQDYEAAAEELTPVAEYLGNNPNERIVVFGMTATITGGGAGIELSEDRAEAVKALLVESGAHEEQISCVGLGQVSNPLRVNDVDEEGNQIEELAQKNRAVFVVDAESKTVDTLLKCLQ